MSNGPTLIYDKSVFQSLNREEAWLLGTYFRTVMTPIFLIEVLGDLKKSARGERTPEQIVGGLAGNVSPVGTMINVNYRQLFIDNLLGNRVQMNRIPLVSGGEQLVTKTGETGLFFDEAPDMAALRRWEEGKFDEMEHALADQWRRSVAEIDMEGAFQQLRWVKISLPNLKTLEDAARIARQAVVTPGRTFRILSSALRLLQVPEDLHGTIIRRWKQAGRPPLPVFAPYAAYVMTVELFFLLGVGADLIRRGVKSKSRVDISYLYYLPFCMAFTSSDNFHRDTAILFMDSQRQRFIPGTELKADLKRLATYKAEALSNTDPGKAPQHPGYPPLEGDFRIGRIWDDLLPGWRIHAADPIDLTPKFEAKVLEKLRPMIDAIKERDRMRQPRV
jgi:hypothetical protein